MKPPSSTSRRIAHYAAIAGVIECLASVSMSAQSQAGAGNTYCVPNQQQACVRVAISTTPVTMGTSVEVHVSNLEGVALPGVTPVSWARLFQIELVARDDGQFGGGDVVGSPILTTTPGMIEHGDGVVMWAVDTLHEAGLYRAYVLSTDYTQGGAEIIGCTLPSNQIAPFFQSCGTGSAGSGDLIVTFTTVGTWSASEVGVTIGLQDELGETACGINGSRWTHTDVPLCVAPGAATGNQAPVADAGGPYWGTRGQIMTFDASATTDANGDALAFAWDFGDGTTGTGTAPSHSYAELGAYVVVLSVTDSQGAMSTVTTNSTVEIPLPLVVAGEKYSCALRANGTARCWGAAPYGGNNVPSSIEYSQLTAGFSTSCGLKADGTIGCYGSDGSGQTSFPAGIFAEVSIGKYHGCALDRSGLLNCWGLNAFHAKDLPAGQYAQVSAGWLNSCAIRPNGTLACAGINYPTDGGTITPPAGVFIQVSTGEHHACAMRPDRTLLCWGYNNYGEVGGTPFAGVVTYSPPGTFKEVRAGISHTCALRGDGTVNCWGYNVDGRSTPPSGTFIGVAASSAHSCGVRTDHSIVCWGTNSEGQTNVPSEFLPAGGTQPGTAVVVAPADPITGTLAPITLTFTTVTGGGLTTATTSNVGQAGSPPVPAGFRLGNPPTYYDIQTTATFSGAITLCVDYTSVSYGNENNLKLLHYDAGSGSWQDVTTSLNTASNEICGTVSSLSPFLVAEPNVAPVVTAIGLPAAPVPVGQSAGISAGFTDQNPRDTHTGSIEWDDGQASSAASISEASGSGTASGQRTYGTPGVYTITVSVTDGELAGQRASGLDIPAYVVVYDPSAGFVTGGGWISSPTGACLWNGCNPEGSTTGKASFGFVSRYQKGATAPSGTTEFQFSSGGLSFSSSSYQWLVVSGSRAQFKGDGTINGAGSYGFLLTAIDGALAGGGGTDKFRIKIWNKASGVFVYDNQMGATEDSTAATGLGGGSIVIHN